MDYERLVASFKYAWQGIVDVWQNEQNFRIHACVALTMVVLGFVFSLNAIEWLFVILAITGVLSTELMNTAVERSVDLITREQHPLAKRAKDASAAAVLIYACMAFIVGIVIFVPKIIKWCLVFF
ncbi:diacylglycerol kinase [Jeotgalibacillus soli]|uniref:Diacylglycerol kinase (ATP dependent) n=1 Tax=Jeotgalibacillus soli TaxID=889306 RepID=A0A0C2RRR7_9BACL|nr:diacylglycerol kinase family protein [Jeotgalibacillus soli]KIL44444.1 diacylglycerol kinase (ATP dependent) [Jeotgalibacillus soli]